MKGVDRACAAVGVFMWGRRSISTSCAQLPPFLRPLYVLWFFVFSPHVLPRDPVSANLFVRAVDSAVLSTIGSYASIRGNDFPDASSLIVFASSTAFVVPLRKASTSTSDMYVFFYAVRSAAVAGPMQELHRVDCDEVDTRNVQKGNDSP